MRINTGDYEIEMLNLLVLRLDSVSRLMKSGPPC